MNTAVGGFDAVDFAAGNFAVGSFVVDNFDDDSFAVAGYFAAGKKLDNNFCTVAVAVAVADERMSLHLGHKTPVAH